MKPFIKRDERTHARTDGHRAFCNIQSYRPVGDKKGNILSIIKFAHKTIVVVDYNIIRAAIPKTWKKSIRNDTGNRTQGKPKSYSINH